MKTFPLLIAALACGSYCLADEPEFTIATTATLKDGSVIKADFLNGEIKGSTAFLNELTLKPEIVRSLTFTGTNGAAKVELTNNDQFGMRISNENFTIKSSLGELKVPCDGIRSLTFRTVKARQAAGGQLPDGLVYACSFDTPDGIATPEIGPSGKMELGELSPNGGKTGGALFVKPGVAGAQIAIPANTFGSNGCIEFWANMRSGKTEFSTGGDPRFFLLTMPDGTELAHLEYASNDGVGHCGLTAHLEGIRVYTHEGFRGMMPYSDIFRGENFNGWHHYALSWTPQTADIYLDGKKICRGYGTVNGTLLAGETILEIPLSRTRGKSFNNKSAFLMDDLKIWNYAKSEFDVSK